MSIEACDALILCGGLGSRLQPVIADRPKGLAPVGGRPLLDILVEDLRAQGCRRIVFCVGHMKEQIITRYQGRSGAEYLFSTEETPLGTGGALWNALHLVHTDTMLVMNGDSICHVDYRAFLDFHCNKGATASFVVTPAGDRNDSGVMAVDADQHVRSFLEKPQAGSGPAGYTNAGIYLLQTGMLPTQPATPPFSLENDVFPVLVAAGDCFAYAVASKLTDIGTPARYQEANQSLD